MKGSPTTQTPKLDIIIPVYYEQETVRGAIEQIEKNVKTPHRVLAIWQDKKDPSIQVLKELEDNISNLKLIQSLHGIGIIGAIKTGFKQSLAPIIVITVADLSDDPRTIDKMVKMINKGYDFVCASRYSKGGERIGGPFLKVFLSYLACKLLNLLTDIPSTDATYSFKCFRKSFIDTTQIESTGGFEICLELLLKAHEQGLKIGEVPTLWKEREKGKSKFTLGKLWQWLPQYLRWYYLALIRHNKIKKLFSFLFCF